MKNGDEDDFPLPKHFMNMEKTETTETMMTVSAAQRAANRVNARKSTGPKTSKGKAASKLNAVKHGLLAQTVLVRGEQFQESAQGFKRLSLEFYASLAPVGPLEEMLVDEIIQATWRLRRAWRAEGGEIALSVDDGWRQRRNHNPVPLILFQRKASSLTETARLEQSSAGCSYLINCLRKVLLAVRAEGELTEAVLEEFKASVEYDLCLFTTVLSYHQRSGRTGEKEEGETALSEDETPKPAREDTRPTLKEDRAKDKAKVLGLIEREMHRLLLVEEECERREAAEEQTRQAAAVLPTGPVVDRILRYETALERQLYRAMNQLERLQRRRQGEHVPAPVAIQTA